MCQVQDNLVKFVTISNSLNWKSFPLSKTIYVRAFQWKAFRRVGNYDPPSTFSEWEILVPLEHLRGETWVEWN